MRPACEPGYEAQCAHEGPYADDEVTDVEDMTDYVAAMHRDGTADDVAADGGEGEDMATQEQMTGELPWETRLELLLDEASDLQLKSGKYAFERQEKKRLEAAHATLRALDPNAPKPRATRRDKGTKRAPRESTVGGEELTARAERRAAS